MRVVCVVQARMGSSRFPGKSLQALAGRPMVLHVLERAAAIEGIDDIVMATSRDERDDLLSATAVCAGYGVVRGSERDVLDRFVAAAAATRADAIVRVTGDCPLLCTDVGSLVVGTYRREAGWWDYVSNDTFRSGFPDGTDVEVFSRDALERAARHATAANEREHVTVWMRRALRHKIVHHDEDYRHLKLSVDTPEDLELVRKMQAHLGPQMWTLADTVAALEKARRNGHG